MDLVVAGGVQNMSMIPISSAMLAGQALGFDDPFTGSPGWTTRYGTGEVSQFVGAEMMVTKWHLVPRANGGVCSRPRTCVQSRRNRRAASTGRSSRSTGWTIDEGPREPNWDKIRSLKTLTPDWSAHRGLCEPDQRRLGCPAHRQ